MTSHSLAHSPHIGAVNRLFVIGTVALSVALTWVYNHTSRNILGIVLLHGWVNFTAETIEVADVSYHSQ